MIKHRLLYIILFIFILVIAGCDKHHESNTDTSASVSNSTNNITTKPLVEAYDEKIARIVTSRLASLGENPTLGISIVNLKTQKVLYTLNADRSFVPASVMKMVTATNAIYLLGPHYHYHTTLAITSMPVDQALNGNVYIRFSGDPTLTQKELYGLLESLVKKNIATINGNVILDLSYFPKQQDNPGFMSDDEHFGYAAFTDAIILDHNQFDFYLFPSKELPGKAVMTSEANLKFNPVKFDVITSLQPSDDCPIDLYSDEKNNYTLTGCIPFGASPYQFSVAIHNPTQWVSDQISDWLTQHHIKLNGAIIIGKMPHKTITLTRHESPDLSYMVQYLLKSSDNIYANSIFKTVGAIYQDDSASWHNGERSNIQLLKKIGVNTSGTMIVDGAGLSRYNLLTPNALQQIIIYDYAHPEVGNYIFPGLPVSGIDGTLRRYKLGKFTGNFVAKSGTMKQIATIAGILKTKNNPPLGIVVMINGNQRSRVYFYFIHNIVQDLAQEQF